MNPKSLRELLYLCLFSTTVLVLVIAAVPSPAAAVRASGTQSGPLMNASGSLYDWQQFGFDPQHSGNDTRESTINASNVNKLRKLFQVKLPSVADGAPVYLSAVTTSTGVRNLLFVTSKAGHIVALNGLTGSTVWTRQYGPGSCKINNGTIPCYTTSSPVIDPNRRYVYSYGLDGKVHKYRVGGGSEIMTGGFPEVATLKPFNEKGSSALSLVVDKNGTSHLYVTNGGYPGDGGDYQGHVTMINLATGKQHVFNTMCSNLTVHFVEKPGTPDCLGIQSAVWARPGVVYDAATNKIYLATGNGFFNPGALYWGDTVFALSGGATGASGKPLDSYTPTNYQQLQDTDLDLGSTAPAILPVPANSTVENLAVQGGKDAKLRLLNLSDLSGQGGPGHTGGEVGAIIDVPQGGQVLTQPAVWVNPSDGATWVFIANGNGISGLKLALGAQNVPELHPVWQKANGGTSPIVANGVLFYAGPGNVWALDPTTGGVLWNSTQIGGIHWESPIVANGVLYLADENGNLTAFR